MECANCKHWQKWGDFNTGKCYEILEKVEPEIVAYNNDYSVKFMETDAKFGCNMFEE